MKLLGPVAFVLATLALLAVASGFHVGRRDGKDLTLSDGFVLFGLYVWLVLVICAIVDFLVATVKTWRT